MTAIKTCLVIHRSGLSDLTSTTWMVEVPAWDSGVPGLVLTPNITLTGATSLARGVMVTHEPTGLACTKYPLSIANARRHAMELGKLGDWTTLREAGLPDAWKPEAAAAWARADLRDDAEREVAYAGLTEDESAALERMESP